MLSQRVKAALIFVPLVLILIFLGGWIFNLFITVILLLAAFEFFRLFQRTGYRPSFYLISCGVILMILERCFFDDKVVGTFLSLTITATIFYALIGFEQGDKDSAINLTINLTGILYLGWVGGFLIPLRALPNGLGWTLTALPATWLADCGAYFIGCWVGKRKLTPELSPNKTLAGLLGGILVGTLSGLLLVLLWRVVSFLPIDTPLWQGLVLGFVVSSITPVGDLVISLFKRTAGVKDTGNLIPGHGGVLDRIDSWIWAGMLGYYFVVLFQ